MTKLLPQFTQVFIIFFTFVAQTAALIFPTPTAPSQLSHAANVQHTTTTKQQIAHQQTIQTSSKTNQDTTFPVSPTPKPIVSPTSSLMQKQSATTQNDQITPTLIKKILTAKSTIVMSGKTIILTLLYPNTGGTITGTITGDCSGTVSGNYDGPATGKLTGTAKATCPEGFFSVPVDITYNGTLDDATQAVITYTVSAMGQNSSGTTNLTLSE